jgi:hypothetical protein
MSKWRPDLDLVRLHDGTTSLTGPVPDHAQLHGVLARIRDLDVPPLILRTVDVSRLQQRSGLRREPACGTGSRVERPPGA